MTAEKTEKQEAAASPRSREFYLHDDGIPLHARLDLPVGGERCPLAIVLHGFTGHMEERHITAVAEAMRELGIATLRVELYGHGQSGGAFADHNLYKWLNNVMAVVDYAKGLDFVTELYLCGHSQGGLTTILAAGMMPGTFRAILPLSPALAILSGAREGNLLGVSFDPTDIPDEIAIADRTLRGHYIRAAQTLHAEEAIRRYRGPVLLVHGDADAAVPLRDSVAAAEAYENAKLAVIAGDTHCYEYHLDEVVAAVKDFLAGLVREA